MNDHTEPNFIASLNGLSGFVLEVETREHPVAAQPGGSPPCRAGEHRNELSPRHSITSSARASTLAGISMPSALAVLRLITSSNLVGC